MKKSFIALLAALAVCALPACQKNESLGQNEEQCVRPDDDPTEDQMAITTNIEAKVYGTAPSEDGITKSLIARLSNKVGTFNDNTTKLCVITDAAIAGNQITPDEYLEIYRCYQNGGTILVTTPSVLSYSAKFQVEMALAEYYYFVKENDLRVNGEIPQMPDRCHDFDIDEVTPEQALDGILFDCVGFNKTNRHLCMDADDPYTDEDGKTIKPTPTAFQYGIYADAVVSWVERMSKDDKTKADDTDLTKVASAWTKEYTHDINYWSYYLNEKRTSAGAISEIFTVYTAHSIPDKKDFYYVTQDMSFYSGRIKPVPYPDRPYRWFVGDYDNYGKQKTLYVSCFSSWEAQISLSMDGCSPKVRSSSPQAENASTTYTRTVTDGVTSSESNGINVGGSIGGSMGGGFTAMFTPSYNHTWTSGTTHSVTVGSSRSKSDITIQKYTDKDNCVRWSYTGNEPSWYTNSDDDVCWKIGSLLISDMTQTNAILFEVPNAKGTARLSASNEHYYRSSYGKAGVSWGDEYKLGYRSLCRTNYCSFNLPTPFRSIQHWVLSIDSYGNIENDPSLCLQLSNIIVNQLLKGNATFDMPDIDDNSTASAQAVMELFIKDIKNYSLPSAINGTFRFKMVRQSDGASITKVVHK